MVVSDLGALQFDGVVSKSQNHRGESHGPESLPVTLEAFSISSVFAEVIVVIWQYRCDYVDFIFRNFCISFKWAVIRVRVLRIAVVIFVLSIDLILHVVNVHDGKVSPAESEQRSQELSRPHYYKLSYVTDLFLGNEHAKRDGGVEVATRDIPCQDKGKQGYVMSKVYGTIS